MGYGKASQAAAQKFHDKLGRGNWWKAKQGVNRIRIMPPFEGAEEWWKEWVLHWRVGPRRATVPCLNPRGSSGEPCAICEEVERLRNIGDKESIEAADSMAPQWGVMVNIIDLAHPDVGVQPFPMCKTIISGLIGYDVDEDYGDITHPEKGFDMKIERFAPKTQPLYDVKAAREMSPLADMGWLQEMEDVAKAFRMYTHTEQQAILRGERISTAPGEGEVSAESAPAASTPTENAPAETTLAAPAEAKGKVQKPRCLGKDFQVGDQVCKSCKSQEECQRLTAGEPEAAPEEVAPEEAVQKPRCFGKMYDGRSTECKECPVMADCKAAKADAKE